LRQAANSVYHAGTGGFQTHFICNVCGQRGETPDKSQDPEIPTCSGCRSNVRTRGLLWVLSQELFGGSLQLPSFPCVKSLRGFGTSDSEIYDSRLEAKLGYHNTYFHREPRLDIANPPESELGRYDFVISSEVLEHVAPPAEAAFQSVYRLLRPNGVFVFTVPYSLLESTVEHFPELHEYNVARVGDRHVLVNRTREGKIEVYEDLVFHGGAGSTLEMRVFCEADLKRMLTDAGFRDVRIYSEDFPPFGILRNGPCSLPIAARKGQFGLPLEATRELIEQWDRFMGARWTRLGRKLRLLRSR